MHDKAAMTKAKLKIISAYLEYPFTLNSMSCRGTAWQVYCL